MTNISITNARQNLPKLVNDVYLKGKSVTLTKNGIPMVTIIRADQNKYRRKYTAVEREKAIEEAAGIWKNRWKGKTTEEVVEIIRKKAWRTHAS